MPIRAGARKARIPIQTDPLPFIGKGLLDGAASGRIMYPAHVEISYKDHSKVMADHFSALKRARQTETKTTRNRANKSRLRSALRSLREAITKGDKEAAQTAYRATVSVLDKGTQKGILHKNTASRYKSRLSKRVRAVGAAK
ncbi:MAG: 30S ribosomal protein S20 [Candidatus Korobacteraceae bacterium]